MQTVFKVAFNLECSNLWTEIKEEHRTKELLWAWISTNNLSSLSSNNLKETVVLKQDSTTNRICKDQEWGDSSQLSLQEDRARGLKVLEEILSKEASLECSKNRRAVEPSKTKEPLGRTLWDKISH